MKKILLLGGTGAMGVYLRQYLTEQPDTHVYITSRSSHADTPYLHYLCGDAHNQTFLQTTLSTVKPDVVVDFMVWNTAQFEQVCPPLLQSTRHYLFLSSYRVFAEQNPLTENSPRLLDVCPDKTYLQTDEYGLTKARQENILRRSGKKNWTILRPCITYSKNRFQLGCLEAETVCFRSLQGLPVVLPEEMLDRQTTLTWAGDTARLIERLILNPQAYAQDFNLATAEHHSWREIAGYYREILGTNIQPIPLQKYINVFGPSYQLQYDRMFNRTLDNRKVLAVTGFTQAEFMPLKQGLTKELSSFQKNPVYKNVDIQLNARMDRLCHTQIPLTGFTAKDKLRYYLERNVISEKLLKIKRRLRRK